MSTWTRIPDDDQFIEQELTLSFLGPNGPYQITLAPTHIDRIFVRFEGEDEQWIVSVKEANASGLRLSGVADWVPQILEQSCWFELTVGVERLIRYWRNRAIHREDVELTL